MEQQTFEMYEEHCVMLSMRFPQKLWRIINECKSGAIRWGIDGSTILLNYTKFQEEYLIGEDSIFKTNNITSFIRQLNLYGFRKVTSHSRDPGCNSHNPDIHEFLHENFCNGRMDLLPHVCRKSGNRNHKKGINKLNGKNTIRHLQFGNNKVEICQMSRLQICQLALKEALEQAIQQYKEEKFGIQPQQNTSFTSVNEEEVHYYFNKTSYSSSNESWENATILMPKASNTCSIWYNEIL